MPDPKLQTEQLRNEQLQTEHLKTSAEAQGRLADMAMSSAVRCLRESYAPLEITTRRARDCLRLIAASDLRGWIDELSVIRRKPDSGEASSTPPSSTLQAEYYRLIRILRKRLKSSLLRSSTGVWKRAWKRAIGNVDYAVFRVRSTSIHLHRLASNRQYQHYGQAASNR